MPEVVPDVAASLWGLGEAGREDCVLLAHAIAPLGPAALVSSDERKSRETAEALGLRLGVPVAIDSRFREADRPQVWDTDYREAAAAYLGGEARPGWEPHDQVAQRFGAGIEVARAGARGTVVAVSHGLAMSLWTASVASVEVVSWWRELTFPDAWRVDAETGEMERVWMGGTRGE